ncbi:hypothetical protein LTR01_005827 [Friedmanniomyces endolithicus]|nr:hypothetical protein LTR01_005827 [Friedmanniomyces endolithicus]
MTTPEMKATLSARHVDFRNPIGQKRARVLLTRADCGFVSYEGKSSKELRQDCQGRGFEPMQRATRADMMAILEKADYEKMFPRFMDDGSAGDLAVQPPLKAVRKLLRQETLPLFYSYHRFGLHGYDGSMGQHSYDGYFLHRTSKAMLCAIGVTNRSRIRKLRLHRTDFKYGYAFLECDVDFGSKDGPARVWGCQRAPANDLWGEEDRENCVKIDAQISKVLSMMTARPKGSVLQPDDAEDFIMALSPDGVWVMNW